MYAMFSTRKKSREMRRATGTQIRFGGHSCGNTGSAVALTSSFRASVDADKILSLFLSFSLSWHWTDVLTNIKMKLSREVRAYLAAIRTIRDLQRANNLWQEILVFHVKLLINQGIYASTSYRTSFVQRGLRVNTLEWLAITSTKAIAMSVLNVVLMNNMLQASKLVI